jgi:hypothetical protein
MFVKYLLYTAAGRRQAQRPIEFLKKRLRTFFKKSLNGLTFLIILKNIKNPSQKIPESLGGIQTIHPEIIKPL